MNFYGCANDCSGDRMVDHGGLGPQLYHRGHRGSAEGTETTRNNSNIASGVRKRSLSNRDFFVDAEDFAHRVANFA
jgi:hypothetical protein